MILMLLGSIVFSVLCLILLAAYLFTGGKKTILIRFAGAGGMAASLLWILRTISERH